MPGARPPPAEAGGRSICPMNRPVLKQFADLTPADFQTAPVWVACQSVDDDEPWYDDTDEETFRPRLDPFPAHPSEGMLLIHAIGTLADGTRLPGFLTPALEPDDLGTMQPHVFLGGRRFGFWGGMLGVPEAQQTDFLNSLGKTPDQVFPILFEVPPGLSNGVVQVAVTGWPKR